jgi:hypothetical protein
MAVVFGGANSYLAGERLKFGLATAAFSVVGLGMSGLALVCLQLVRDWQGGALLVAMLFVSIACFGSAGAFKKRYAQIATGMAGEASVVRELAKLPNSYAVFRGLKASEGQDIDCAVIGPTGVFAVEVKGHKGQIGFDGRRLTRNGRAFEKDFIGETAREAAALRRMVSSASSLDGRVKAVLVFSRAGIPSGIYAVGDVLVTSKKKLAEAIVAGSEPFAISPEKVVRIVAGLASRAGNRGKDAKLAKLRRFYSRQNF